MILFRPSTTRRYAPQDPLTAVAEGVPGATDCEVVQQPAVLIEVRRHSRSLRQPRKIEKQGRAVPRRATRPTPSADRINCSATGRAVHISVTSAAGAAPEPRAPARL